jgi:hypothetical protein
MAPNGTFKASTWHQRLRPWNAYVLLGLVTLAFSALAIFLSLKNENTEPNEFAAGLLLPDLSRSLGKIARLEMLTGDEHVIIEPRANGQWVVANYHDFPVKFPLLRQMIVGLAGLTLLEERTTRPEWHHYLDLVAPEEGGAARRYILYGKDGGTIADILVGKPAAYAAVSGEARFYVRRSGENQSYLAKGIIPDISTRRAWLDDEILSLERERIAFVDMAPNEGPPYRLERLPGGGDFALNTLPQGRVARPASALNAVAGALVGLSFLQVTPVDQIDFKNAAHARYATKDGLVIDVFVASPKDKKGGWISLAARVEESLPTSASFAEAGTSGNGGRQATPADRVIPNPVASPLEARRNEALALGARFKGWAFEAPPYKADLLSRSLQALSEDKPARLSDETSAAAVEP